MNHPILHLLLKAFLHVLHVSLLQKATQIAHLLLLLLLLLLLHLEFVEFLEAGIDIRQLLALVEALVEVGLTTTRVALNLAVVVNAADAPVAAYVAPVGFNRDDRARVLRLEHVLLAVVDLVVEGLSALRRV